MFLTELQLTIFFSTYLVFILLIWAIVSNDSRRENIFPGIDNFIDHPPSPPQIELLSPQLEFIDLRGQEADEDFEFEREIRIKIVPQKKKSQNFSRVEEMPISEVLEALSSLGRSSTGIEKEDRKTLVKYLDGIETNNLRGLYYEGDHENLKIFANARLLLFPSEISTRLLLIRSLYSNKDYPDCIKQCERILSVEKRHIDSHRFIARSLHSMGETEKSRDRYEKISQLSWDDIDSRYSLLKLHWNDRDYVGAEIYVNQLLDISPDDVRFQIFSGRILGRMGKHEDALVRWQILMDLDPDNIEALLGIGISLLSIGKTESALESLILASELSPEDSRINKQIIRAYSRLGLLHLAIPLLQRECEIEPLSYRIWQRRFSLELRVNGDSSSETLFEEILSLNNHDRESFVLAIFLANDFSFIEHRDQIIDFAFSRFSSSELYYQLAKKFAYSDHIGFSLSCLSESFGSLEKIPHSDEVLIRIKTSLSKADLEIDSLIDSSGKIIGDMMYSELILLEVIKKCANRNNEHWKWQRKIAMLSSSLGLGGAERQVVSCLRGLMSAKDWSEVRLFCNQIDPSRGQAGTFEGDVNQLGINITEYGVNNDPRSLLSEDSEEIDDLLNLLPANISRSIRRLENQFSIYQPSLVHSWQDSMNVFSGIAGLIAGVPNLVMFARSQRPDRKTKMHTYGKKHLARSYQQIMGTGRAILAHNSKSGAKSYSDWLDLPMSSFEIIYNGVDFENVLNPNAKLIQKEIRDFNIPSNSPVIGTVFRFVPEKRPELWIEIAQKVMQRIPNSHFIMVGGGQLFESFKLEIEQLELNERIHLVGQSFEVSSWLERFDLFLLTSRVEGLPNVLIESLAMGVPVVSTDAGGSRETFIDGKTGILCENSDSSEISEKIVNVLSDEYWMENASILAAIQTRQKFGQEKMIERLLEIYAKAIK